MISTRPLGVSRSIPPWDLSFPFPHMKNSLGSTVPGQSKKHLGWIKPGMDRTVCLDLFFMINFTYFVFLLYMCLFFCEAKEGNVMLQINWPYLHPE